MVRKNLPVRWSPKAKQRLDNIYDYIAKDSVSAARYFKKSLVQLGGSLSDYKYTVHILKNKIKILELLEITGYFPASPRALNREKYCRENKQTK